MRFVQRDIFGGGAFADTGKPTGIFWNRDNTLLAVASSFNFLQWHGRDVQTRRRLAYRVSVYDAKTLRTVRIFDRPRYPINEIAFHPHRPLVAVATGRYDGGYFYKGKLFIWDLETGKAASILDQKREVTRCRFDETGALQITLRPVTDEDEPDTNTLLFLDTTIGEDAWWSLRDKSVAVESLPITASRIGTRRDGYVEQDETSVQQTLAATASDVGFRYEPRWLVWDLAWTADDRILAVRNATALECWTMAGERVQHLPAELHGVQVLCSPSIPHVYVNLHGGWKPFPPLERNTQVERIDLNSWTRHVVRAIDFLAALSIAASGHLLARDTGHQWYRQGQLTRDRVVAPDLSLSPLLDLGDYDLFNHYLRIDGAPHLYFLQGTRARTDWKRREPPRAHENKWVCRINPDSLRIQRLIPLEWDEKRGAHLFGDPGVYIRDAQGESLILAHRLHDPRSLQDGGSFIVRRHLVSGAVAWIVWLDAQVTALVSMPELNSVAFALTDGQLGAVDSTTGQLLVLEPLTVEGTANLALALASWKHQLAVGTVDGRIIIYDCWR